MDDVCETEQPKRRRRIGCDHTNFPKISQSPQEKNNFLGEGTSGNIQDEVCGAAGFDGSSSTYHDITPEAMMSSNGTHEMVTSYSEAPRKLMTSENGTQEVMSSNGAQGMATSYSDAPQKLVTSENVHHVASNGALDMVTSYSEPPKKLAQNVASDDTSDDAYSKPPVKLNTQDGANGRDKQTQNGRGQQQLYKRKHGVFEPNPQHLITKLNQAEPEVGNQSASFLMQSSSKSDGAFKCEHIQVAYLWPIFDVIFKQGGETMNFKTNIANDDFSNDDNDKRDDGNDDESEDHGDTSHNQDDVDDNEKGRSDDEAGRDHQNDDGGGHYNNTGHNDDGTEKNDDIWNFDDNEDDDTHYDVTDDVTTMDCNTFQTYRNVGSQFNEVACPETFDDSLMSYHGNQVAMAGRSSFIAAEKNKKQFYEEEGNLVSQTEVVRSDINNNVESFVDVCQVEALNHTYCQNKQLPTGKEGCSHGNQRCYPSVGVVSDDISICDSNFNTNNSNDFDSFEDFNDEVCLVDMDDQTVAKDNSGHMTTVHHDVVDVTISTQDVEEMSDISHEYNNNGDANKQTTLTVVKLDSHHHEQDAIETNHKTELESNLHCGMTLDCTPLNSDIAEILNIEAVRKIEKVKYLACDASGTSSTTVTTDTGTTVGNITKGVQELPVGIHAPKAELLEAPDITKKMADRNTNIKVSQLTINIAPRKANSASKYSSMFQPTGSDVTKEEMSSRKSSKSASKTRELPKSQGFPPVYTNEVVVLLSSDDCLSDSDYDEDYSSAAVKMEHLRKVSRGDIHDFTNLKVVTEKLQLNHRRPSCVAWKEKNMPTDVEKKKGGRSSKTTQGQSNDLEDGSNKGLGQSLTLESNEGLIDNARSPNSSRRLLINKKALTPPTERAFLGSDLEGRPRSSSFKSPSRYSYDYTATLAPTRSLESLQNSEKVSSRRAEVCRSPNMLDISENHKTPTRTGSKSMISSNGSLPSIREEKVDSSGAILSEFERRKKVDDSIEWIRNELQDMKILDCTLAKQLLRLHEEIRHYRLQVCNEQQREMLEDAFAKEKEKSVEKKFDMADIELPEKLFSPELRQVGITRMNITTRRFSVF